MPKTAYVEQLELRGRTWRVRLQLKDEDVKLLGVRNLYKSTGPSDLGGARKRRPATEDIVKVAPEDVRLISRAGTLDDTSWLRPTAHFWTRSKQPWITLPEGDQIFETQPAT
jgi:hypothetical protein